MEWNRVGWKRREQMSYAPYLSEFEEPLDEPVVERVALLVHGLQPGCAVYVGDSRDLSALRLCDSGGHGHVRGDAPALASRDVVEPISSVF